ncbi:Uncharacterized protein BP5553_06699 [Venustampulla echinocandica]|uniref:Glutamine amidotransferase type-2 domain-containing protein n=1 Tax=Venustampulla echinocandica TaxID=2656787 RepID=A0A370TKR1_9HELO|nr:Uncharacterized protein BP5553_06699 [Venustampulla echinocandica]RDL36087.1 Uncharacterized protein BP5553_06699 [Venustampulla echinocandica]
MCRWFSYISASEPCLLEDVLITPAHSISKQVHAHYLPLLISHDPKVHAEPTSQSEISHRNRVFCEDGIGMAWYTPTLSQFCTSSPREHPKPSLHPARYKTTQQPAHDANFHSICANTASNVVFAHIRDATGTAITHVNNHPFIFGIHCIMHNGYISSFEKVKKKLCDTLNDEAYAHIQGSTDSEHFAALLMTYLCPLSQQEAAHPHSSEACASQNPGVPTGWETFHGVAEMQVALQKTINTIINLQRTILGDQAEPNDFNIALTDGRNMVACRFRNHPTEQPPSLYCSTHAGVTLNRKFPDHPDGPKGDLGKGNKTEGHNPNAFRKSEDHGQHVIVASEPTTYKGSDWTLIEKNHLVLVEGTGDVVIKKMM